MSPTAEAPVLLADPGSVFDLAAEMLEPEVFTPKLERYWYDPLGFIRDFMPSLKLTRYQKEIVSKIIVERKLCVRSPHGAGKTALVAAVVLWFAITREDMCRAQGGDWKVVTTASVERQLTKYLWPEIRKWARPRGIEWEKIGREPFNTRTELLFTQLKLEYGEAFAANSDDPANIEGAHADHLIYIVDEAKTVIPETFDAIEGAFSGAGAGPATSPALEGASAAQGTPVSDGPRRGQSLNTGLDEFSPPPFEGKRVGGDSPNGGSSERRPARESTVDPSTPLENEGPAASGPAIEAYALVISTPAAPNGRFYEIQARRPGYEDWWVRFVTLEEAIAAGRIARDWAEKRKRQWTEQSAIYQNRVEGNFAVDAVDGVVPLAWAEAAMLRGRSAFRPQGRIACAACDVARSGQDKTCIGGRIRSFVLPLNAFHSDDTMVITGEVVSFIDAFGVRAYTYASVDVNGLGAGVVDRLREQGFDVEAFNSSSASMWTDSSGELEFLNRRAAAWWGFRELLDPSLAEQRAEQGIDEVTLPDDEELLGDLCTPRYRRTSRGMIAVEEKDQIRKRLGRSPDRGDTVVMMFADRFAPPEDEVVVYEDPVTISSH